MTRFSDLVTRAWMHAKSGPLYLAGYDPYGDRRAILSEEPTAYTEEFIDRAERLSGIVFERVLLSEREQIAHTLHAVQSAYRAIEAKNFWTDDDRRHWRDLGMRYTDLRKALAILDEEAAQDAQADD